MSSRWQHLRRMAADLRTRYNACLGESAPFPLDVYDLAEQVCGLSAFPDPTLDPKINGELNPATQSIRLRMGLDVTRARFIVAHELGHYVIEGVAAIMQDDDTTIDERIGGLSETEDGVQRMYNTRERREQEANLFALELLIPADVLWHLVQQPGWKVAQLAATFAVSTDALRAQLLNVCCLEPVVVAPVQHENMVALVPDSEQLCAINAPLPTLVVAGPGTGKTNSIVAKYVSLVASGVDPVSILALTFSNKAAEEMRTRIIRTINHTRPDLAGRVEVSTFHAWGLNFLKSYAPYVGLPLDFHLRTTGDLFVLLKRRLADLPLEQYKMLHTPGYYLRDIMYALGRAKDELCTPDVYRTLAVAEAARIVASAETETVGKTTKAAEDKRNKAHKDAARLRELAEIYACYEALLREEGVVDYGDLITLSVAALRIPEVACAMQATYHYILVDEFQDINYASGTLVALLDGGRGCVWAVGDPWQSIYRFRGASAANLAQFTTVYPHTTTVSLMRNYRSVQPILDASQSVMDNDPLAATRIAQQAQRPTRQQPVVVEWAAEDQTTEYAAIAQDILRRVGRCFSRLNPRARRRRRAVPRVQRTHTGYRMRRQKFRDHAVLCRNHRQVAGIVAMLELHGIPVDGGGEIFTYPEVKDALAICALASSTNSVEMLRVLTLPEYRLSTDDLELLVRNAYNEKRSLLRAIRDDTITTDLSPEGQATLYQLANLHDELALETDAWRVLTRYLFDTSPTMRHRIQRAACGDALARRELANLGQLVLLARTFLRQAEPGKRDAGAFIAYVRLLIEVGEVPKAAPLPDTVDAVRIMTIHAAKGLEFPNVYLPGLQKDVFPPRNRGSVIPEIGGLVQGPLGDEHTEERYLLYVAMTRAQNRLILSRATGKAGKEVSRSTLLPPDPPWRIRSVAAKRAGDLFAEKRRLQGIPFPQRIVTSTSIETYIKCPRRYLYQYGYQLYDDATPFVRMHQAIRAVVDELIELAQTEALPTDEEALIHVVRHAFRRYRLENVPYTNDYFTEAFQHAQRIWQDLRINPAITRATHQFLIVSRPVGQVEVRIDRIEQTADGLRYVYFKSGRPGKDDQLSTRIILYALAAQTHHPNATLAIRYTSTDKTHRVEHRKQTLETHIAKIDAALAGIAAEEWEPNYGEHCTTCPFYLLCPV